jgi:hypothetical protein
LNIVGLAGDVQYPASRILHVHASDVTRMHLIEKLGISDRPHVAGGAPLQLPEHGEQDERDHEPDRGLSKHAVVQVASLLPTMNA